MALFVFLAVVAGGRWWDAPARAGATAGWKQGRILLAVMGTLRWEQQPLPSPHWPWAGQAELVSPWWSMGPRDTGGTRWWLQHPRTRWQWPRCAMAVLGRGSHTGRAWAGPGSPRPTAWCGAAARLPWAAVSYTSSLFVSQKRFCVRSGDVTGGGTICPIHLEPCLWRAGPWPSPVKPHHFPAVKTSWGAGVGNRPFPS